MRILPVLCFAFLPAAVTAHDYQVGDMVVMHPIAFETPQTAMSGAGYLTITNTGETADRLLGVEADFPRVMVHDTKVEDGVSSMFHVDSIEIAPGETIELAPGGKHVMFMGLNGDPFEIDEEVNAVLIFENAGRLDVVFKVEARPTDAAQHGAGDDDTMDHGDHADKDEDHSGH